MMQQFATASSKLAVSSNPMDTTTSGAYAKENKSANADARTSFEKAIASAEQSTFLKSSDFVKSKDPFEKQVFEQPVIREPIYIDEAIRAGSQSDTVNNAQKVIAEIGDAQSLTADDLSSAENSSTKLSSETLSNEGEPRSDIGINKLIKSSDALINIDAKSMQSSIVIEAESDITGADLMANATNLMSSANLSKEFDYIHFVTQIQALSEEAAGATAPLSSGLNDDEQARDLANISLTEDELQTIADAQITGLDLQNKLTDEQQTKLNDVIDKMLSQFHQLDDGAQTPSPASQESDELDVKLIETMLIEGAKQLVDAEQQNAESVNSKEILNTADYQHAGTAKVALTEASLTDKANAAGLQEDGNNMLEKYTNSEPGSAEVNDELDSQLLTRANEAGVVNDSISILNTAVNAAVHKAVNASAAQSANASPSNSVGDDATDASKQLAMLDERAQTNVIDNIKSRVEKFAADLSGNSTKGSEFVAAMQLGLKEVKEQMQNGQQAGTDLKTLISDALSQANVDIPAQNQPKLDAALNQFVGLMNMANTVNQSTQAQANPVFGLAETQMIKESSAMHAEGTKLAQQTQTALDKAVNIFKPDGQQQLAEKVRWMVNSRNPTAEIRLDPPELGAMQIKVALNADSATVNFTVQSSVTKEALDQALPKLREMLQEQGINLGQSSVEQQSSGQSEQQAQQQRSTGTATGANDDNDAIGAQAERNASQGIDQRIAGSALGGIDYYV